MKDDGASCGRDELARAWLTSTLETYPSVTARFLEGEKDQFRNPVGQALRDGLPVLLEEILGGGESGRAAQVLDQIVRMRAVQDFTPSQAVGFIFLLKEVLHRKDPASLNPAVEQRIDRLALAGFDLFMEFREKIHEIKTSEARRSGYVLDRIGFSRSGGE